MISPLKFLSIFWLLKCFNKRILPWPLKNLPPTNHFSRFLLVTLQPGRPDRLARRSFGGNGGDVQLRHQKISGTWNGGFNTERTIAGYFGGWVFPYISRFQYSLYRSGFLRFRYLKFCCDVGSLLEVWCVHRFFYSSYPFAGGNGRELKSCPPGCEAHLSYIYSLYLGSNPHPGGNCDNQDDIIL